MHHPMQTQQIRSARLSANLPAAYYPGARSTKCELSPRYHLIPPTGICMPVYRSLDSEFLFPLLLSM